MKRVLTPRIEMFSPFAKPFSAQRIEDVIVAPEIIEFMTTDNTKIVAKCTPCQCCACR